MSNTRKEFEIVERKVAVWLINKDGQKRGKITARYTKKATIIAFILYATNDYILPIEGYEVMTGWGYDRTNAGIGYVLWELRDKLREAYGITFECLDWQMLGRWQYELERNGYEVVRVL